MSSREILVYLWTVVVAIVSFVAHQCVDPVDAQSTGCTGTKQPQYNCHQYELGRRSCCGQIPTPVQSNWTDTPVCRVWSGNFTGADGIDHRGTQFFLAPHGSIASRLPLPWPVLDPSTVCDANLKPKSSCATLCLDYHAWEYNRLSILASACGNATECSIRCGCSTYAGTPRGVFDNLPTTTLTSAVTGSTTQQPQGTPQTCPVCPTQGIAATCPVCPKCNSGDYRASPLRWLIALITTVTSAALLHSA